MTVNQYFLRVLPPLILITQRVLRLKKHIATLFYMKRSSRWSFGWGLRTSNLGNEEEEAV